MTLAELIGAHKGDTSYERLADRATKAGYPITSTMLHKLAHSSPQNIPRLSTIEAVAAALRVPSRVVLDAAAESLGLIAESDDSLQEVTNSSQVEALLSVVRHRDPDEIEHLARVVRTVAAALDARRDDTNDAAPPGE